MSHSLYRKIPKEEEIRAEEDQLKKVQPEALAESNAISQANASESTAWSGKPKDESGNVTANMQMFLLQCPYWSFYFLKQQSVSEACTFLRLKASVHNVCMPFSIPRPFLLKEVKPQSVSVASFTWAGCKFQVVFAGVFIWKPGILHSGESQHIFTDGLDLIWLTFIYLLLYWNENGWLLFFSKSSEG